MVDLEKVKQEAEMKSQATLNHTYPEPLARYSDVVADSDLFMETLAKLHATMGTKLRFPVIAGKQLDLHHFFVEVTSRGGIDKATNDGTWREIIASFNLPSTATNASTVLRKYYTNLLLHYEKIYFFGSQGWNSPSPAPSERSDELIAQQSPTRNHQNHMENNYNSLPGGTQIRGVIDGRFDEGYFVTITVGSEKMKGVVYPITQETELSGIADISNGRRRKRKSKNNERGENEHEGIDMYNRALVIRDAVPIRQLPMDEAYTVDNSSESNAMKSYESEQDPDAPCLEAELFN